jgi:hypothetical protein
LSLKILKKIGMSKGSGKERWQLEGGTMQLNDENVENFVKEFNALRDKYGFEFSLHKGITYVVSVQNKKTRCYCKIPDIAASDSHLSPYVTMNAVKA